MVTVRRGQKKKKKKVYRYKINRNNLSNPEHVISVRETVTKAHKYKPTRLQNKNKINIIDITDIAT